MIFPLVPKSVTLNGAVAVILRCFADIKVQGPIISQWLKLDPYCLIYLQQKCGPKNVVVSNVSLMVIFSEVTGKKCVKGEYFALNGKNSNCARLHAGVGNS